eukprot:CAMPEP_0169072682 /NCGR_PEP_ID=MMETSP1015-20121227/6332_1 /TAXON_ID=342587 /ORGANISM="Karlodinium micrum, Strain CCMP2283" /LENGTH=673 /DNA_ID=CAMNT_0009131869 /DNA_START=273 /DNA_END=2294 /DNA_ORIENTATION=-
MGKWTEGVVFGWRKKVGEKIAEDEILCHIERGQVTDDIKSPVEGILVERCAGEETEVNVGDNLAIVEVSNVQSEGVDARAQAGRERAVELLKKYQNGGLFGSGANSFLGAPQVGGLGGLAAAAAASPSWGFPPGGSMGGSMLASSPLGNPAATAAALQKANNMARSLTAGMGLGSTAVSPSAGSKSATSAEAFVSKLTNSMPQQSGSSESRSSLPTPAAKAAPAPKEDFENLRCHLHKKANNACKFCKKYVAAKKQAEDDANAKKQAKASADTELKFNCSPLLRERVVGCSYYKSLFRIDDVEGLIEEIKEFATDTLDVYKTATEPSCFMCCVYRLFTLNVSEEKLRRLMDNFDCAHARCVGILYVRLVVPPDQLWTNLEEYILDDEELTDETWGETSRTIGEYVEDLLLKDKYFNTPLPRIPAGVRRELEENLAPMMQYRKRTAANRRIFGTMRNIDMPVEVCDNGRWRPGQAMEIVRQIPSRLKLRVELTDGSGQELLCLVGKVVVRDDTSSQWKGRSRSPRRNEQGQASQREGSPDWSRFRGKSDAELIEELRGRTREDAVCSDRRGYAKRLPRFETGLATNREKGPNEAKLIEVETYITPGMRRREGYTNTYVDDYANAGSLKHQTEEDDRRKALKKDIFQKYGQQKKTEEEEGKLSALVDGPDTMRLG